mmetsp:Transcript_30255/g.39628  ORF Transcript_30255/g.39628 Transcript_30255/m.39628 type:complete len:178 (+) Transcript_30255:29-562(+)|eukprot:CAMPEP_0195260944 /NCGR_PEP_ID=MMETSP0706-20130129/8857_1 /TAXON_ID=33640 /ORGANISM="Asterionellopsis glacialis, Strain CCMP134" /LENGTH=177 /DNA_ID=CAMNT_0040314723 /DNA_START=25 /DNA_END=558 /DNA_ORIENTATION=-
MAKGILEAEVIHHDDHDHGVIDDFFEPALEFTNIICGWILLISVSIALLNVALLVAQHFLGKKFNIQLAITQPAKSPLTLDRIKLELGRFVGFCLLMLVPADVLETLLKPMHHVSMEDLYKVAMVGAIRTTLAYFLGKELEEVMHHIEHAEHSDHHGEEHHDEKKEDKKKTESKKEK